ncbi:MAG: hypothetical protein ACI9O6_000106 [Glaciecola sp.]|jgi:hypothetical protein
MQATKIQSRTNEAPDIQYWLTDVLNEAPLLVTKIMRNTPCDSHDLANQGLLEVMRFMYLCTRSQGTLTPSALLDEVWHEFILFTRTYLRFCENRLNQFVHHQPSNNISKERSQYQDTLNLYQQQFGVVDTRFWPQVETDVAQCGPCENA